MIAEASVETEQNSGIQHNVINETPRNQSNRKKRFWDEEPDEPPHQQIHENAQFESQPIAENANQKISSRPKTALNHQKIKLAHRSVSASHKRPSTAREVKFDENIPDGASSQRKINRRSAGAPSSATTARLSEFQPEQYPNGYDKTSRPISGLSTIFHTNDRSITFDQSHNGDSTLETMRQKFENYQISMQRSKIFGRGGWSFNDKYDYIKNDKKPNLSALKTLTFEVKQKTQPIFSLANPEYFQQNRLSQVASHFDSSKIVLPENHTFMDLITAMERNEHFDKAASSNMTDSRMTHTSRLGREKSLENLAFAEKSYRSSIVYAPELRKESDMPPVRYIMPRSSSMELPRKGVMQKPLVRTAPKRETSGINDIIAFEQLKDHQKLNSLAGLAFVVSKRSKSKYLSMYYELVRETASKLDWSKYRKDVQGSQLNGLIIDVTTFDHLLMYNLKIDGKYLSVPTIEGSVNFEDMVRKFQENRRAKVALAIVYSTEENVKHVIFKRFLVSPQESSFEEDMKTIFRFYLAVLVASKSKKQLANISSYDGIHRLIEGVMDDNYDAIATVGQDILRLNEETIWIDYQAGVHEVSFNRFLRRRFPEMTEGTQARPTQRLRSQQSVSASIKFTHYPETQEMQSFLKESNGTDTDDPTMPNFNDLILVNTKIRAQSSMRRDKSQSYEKQVAVIKERTLSALRSSSKEFRALQAENLRCSPPEKKPAFDGRVVNNEAADSLFVYDKTWIKARYKQPLLVPKIPQNYNRRYSNERQENQQSVAGLYEESIDPL